VNAPVFAKFVGYPSLDGTEICRMCQRLCPNGSSRHPFFSMKQPKRSSSSSKAPVEKTAPAQQASVPTEAAPETGRIKVLLVDDHPLMRQGIKALIAQHSRFEVCGEAIVDISLQSTNGIELTKGLRSQRPSMQVLIISMHDENVYAERALRAGAMGYVMKHEAGEKIIIAMEQILGGEVHLSDRVKGRMLHRFVQHRTNVLISPMEKLSDREMEVFQLLGNGYGTREIANLLNLSVKTIDSYREHLKEKLSLSTGNDLVRHAIQWTKSQAL
jgi:DNA-binding NarL/FixJ family response regulator